MLEIYNDSIYDLLVEPQKRSKRVSLDVKINKEGRVEVEGLSKKTVNSVEDVIHLFKIGLEARSTAAIETNESSSRSHMVVSVDVTAGVAGEETTSGTLYLVDLAGSERVRKSGVDGTHLKEAIEINKSLSALGNVMEALDRKADYIPYRDSKLTYLLQDSLGGKSRTMMLVAVQPSSTSFDETNHALNFASRVKNINIGGHAKRNTASRKNLFQTIKFLSDQVKALTLAKETVERELRSLKRQHKVLDRLMTPLATRNAGNENMIARNKRNLTKKIVRNRKQ